VEWCAVCHKTARRRCCRRSNLTKLAAVCSIGAALRGGVLLIKTFLFGILLGLAAAAGALYLIPAVDQHREVSIINVAPNSGNRESFHINIPMDRVMVGAAGEVSGIPAGLVWPQDAVFAGVSSEIFKIRNARDAVVGVAARTVAKEDETDVIDWMLHLPARGSLFINMEAIPQEAGHRIGKIRTGTQEFEPLTGFVAERWVSDTSGAEGAPTGRIELLATYIARAEAVEEVELDDEFQGDSLQGAGE
jgi:hypothetical protein